MLWSYQSLDDRVRIRNEAKEIKGWTEAGNVLVTRRITVCQGSRTHNKVVQRDLAK